MPATKRRPTNADAVAGLIVLASYLVPPKKLHRSFRDPATMRLTGKLLSCAREVFALAGRSALTDATLSGLAVAHLQEVQRQQTLGASPTVLIRYINNAMVDIRAAAATAAVKKTRRK